VGLVFVRRICRGLSVARLWVALDLHELSIAAAPLPPAGGRPDVVAIETTEKAIRRFIDRLARTLRKTPGPSMRSDSRP